MTGAGPGARPGDAQILAGRYRLDERIGVGAMGEVWQARDLRLQRDVAVKRVRLDGHVDAAAQARFQREAVAMAGVSHPNVVSVYDAGADVGEDQTAYLVMELLDGPSCAELIAGPRSISLGEVERIGAGVARGLAAAHSAGVVHRDIKPSNVVVSRGVPKIVDFGIARLEQEATSTLTAPQSTIGTAAYMSPEQALGKPVGPASDVYSLGALLVALASGSPPFGAANSLALMRAHVDDPPPSLASLRDDAPPSLVELVDRMLAKAPGDRPTAADVAQVLEGGSLPTQGMAAAGPVAAPQTAQARPAATAVYAQPAPVPPLAPADPARGEPSRRSGGAVWWLVAAALLVLAIALGANALRTGTEQDAAPGDPTTAPTPTQSVVTQIVTPTREATTAPAVPPPTDVADEEQQAEAGEGDLDSAVAAVSASIDAVADDEARDQLTRLWQPASSGLQGSNAVDRLREVQEEAGDLFDDEQLTPAERDAISGGIENVIALL